MSNQNKNEKYEIPVILYEEPRSGLKPNPIPYIEISKEGKMPSVLFLFEYKHTGEFEPDSAGEEVEIVDQLPHKFVDLEHLKEKLPPHLNDMVRVLLGMKPLTQAQEEGQVILDKVWKNVDEYKQKLTAPKNKEDKK